MSFNRVMLGLVLRGALVGASLGVVAPPAVTFAGCKCDDDYFGNFKCNSTQTACVAGTHVCDLQCSDPEPPAPQP